MSVRAPTFPGLSCPLPECLEQRGDEEVYLQGHRITLEEVCLLYGEGYTAEMLGEQFPTLPPTLIHRVIAFYLENREAVGDYLSSCRIARDANFARWLNAPKDSPDQAQLRRRLQARKSAAGAS